MNCILNLKLWQTIYKILLFCPIIKVKNEAKQKYF